MMLKGLNFMSFNETLHLPLKVWVYKESLGSAKSSGCGSDTQKVCGSEMSHIQKQPAAGPERHHLMLLSCG